MNLVYVTEKRLFVVLSIISIAVWVGLVVSALGIALVYLLFFFVFYLFAHSAFIAYLKGAGVRITLQQFSDLHTRPNSSLRLASLRLRHWRSRGHCTVLRLPFVLVSLRVLASPRELMGESVSMIRFGADVPCLSNGRCATNIRVSARK